MKMYTKPEIEISVFATEDIITTSVVDDSTTGGATGLSLGGTDGALPDSATGAVRYTDIIS